MHTGRWHAGRSLNFVLLDLAILNQLRTTGTVTC